MINLRESLRREYRGNGHYLISVELDGLVINTITNNTMAIDAAFDEDYIGDDGRYYESREEAQDALISEVLRSNEIEL